MLAWFIVLCLDFSCFDLVQYALTLVAVGHKIEHSCRAYEGMTDCLAHLFIIFSPTTTLKLISQLLSLLHRLMTLRILQTTLPMHPPQVICHAILCPATLLFCGPQLLLVQDFLPGECEVNSDEVKGVADACDCLGLIVNSMKNPGTKMQLF